MTPPAHLYTAPDGTEYEVVDWRWAGAGMEKKRVPLGSRDADGRAFVPVHGGMVRLYIYRAVAYRSLDPKLLADDFRYSVPAPL